MKTLVFFLLTLSLSFGSVRAQGWAQNSRFVTGTWTMAQLKYGLTPKVNIFAEGQIRSQRFYEAFNYWEFKVFAHYQFTDQFALGGGIGTYHQYIDNENFSTPQKQTEFRIWQEMVTKNSLGRINFEHRYRLEERFIDKWNANLQDFTNNYDGITDEDRYRFRYRIQAIVPLNHAKMIANTVYFNVSDEIHMTHRKPYFNQNRFFLGLGYKMEHRQIQVGLLHQFLYGNTFERRKDYLQVSFIQTLSRKKKA